jgi:ABC-type multidrug transport system fused ATPase/permease subunit
MASIYNDDQRQSLINSMTNPESNATKFVEQGEDIGMPRDVTMDILNRYATYGANTGIGNLGGERLVNALNDEYRKRVDEPLQNNPPEMFTGGLTAIAEILQNLGSSAIQGIGNVGSSIADVFAGAPTELSGEAAKESLAALDAAAAPGVEAASVTDAGATGGALNSPVSLENSLLPEATRLEKFQKYLDENPLVARQLMSSGQDIGKILGQALGGGGKRKSKIPVRAPRPRFQPGAIRSQRIGMEDGGSVLGRKLFLDGGEVDGPGGPKEDLVPIWASDKEYVVSHQGVKNIGGGDFDKGIAALDKVNFGK